MADPKSKTAFSYNNGAKQVFGNALRLQRNLYVDLGDPDAAFKASNEGEAHAQNVIIDHVRVVFGMVPFDPETGAGADDDCCEQALQALWDYLAKKNPIAAGSPTSSAPTTSTPAPSTPAPSPA